VLALVLTLVALAPLAQEVLTETLPDGRVVEREVVRNRDGNAVSHGSYKVRYADGEEAVRGRMKDGLRHGKWRYFHPSGKKRATGWYLTGLREKEWTYWDEEGEVNEAESGEYEIVEVPYSRRSLCARGESREGRRHGAWEFFWEHGATKARGAYVDDGLDGSWHFFHADGTFDADWVSGVYRAGRWSAPLSETDRSPLAPLPGRKGKSPAETDALALERLRAGFGEAKLLTEQDAAPMTARRWRSLAALTLADPGYGQFTLPEQLMAAGEAASWTDFRPLLTDGSDHALSGLYATSTFACRLPLSAERRLFAAEDEKSLEAIEAGLGWIVANQRADGAWQPDTFGDDHHTPGATGLALLALVGHGNTLHQGPHAAAVVRGTLWLLEHRDVKTGLLGERAGHAFLYNHGIATMALCEVAAFTESVQVREAAQAALDYIAAARNPGAAWRYDMPPSGDNDTSMTAWMVQALRSGEAAGLDVDSAAFDGAANWIEKATDAKNGRIGYDARGSKSARIQRQNDHFPPELGEAMTAAGLYARILIGETPELDPILLKNASRLHAKPPLFHETFGGEFYYWYYAIHALRQLGGEDWLRWKRLLTGELLDRQERDGSWGGECPWGWAGGSIYRTAMAVLCLEADYRHPVLLER
jgi:hypothetical protein